MLHVPSVVFFYTVLSFPNSAQTLFSWDRMLGCSFVTVYNTYVYYNYNNDYMKISLQV
jgi:hypothetical protein